ncbi:MAG: RNA methyltransferase [Raineya sp.]|nr:RNA methyltransferase [Raineya sp.]
MKSDFEVIKVFITNSFIKKNPDFYRNPSDFEIVKEAELVQVSAMENNQMALAVVKQYENKVLLPENDIVLALDNIQDPGNLGTILRVCDWYGIKKVVCSNQTVDLYNLKVINASKGSFLRVRCFYTDIKEYLKSLKNKKELEIYATVLGGKSIYEITFQKPCIIIMGNEARGVSGNILDYVKQKVSIPRPPQSGAESLNVAIATAVVIDNLFRNVKNKT